MATTTTTETAAQLLYPPNVLHNSALTTVKFISSSFAGAVAGILGLENWLGFTLFLLSTLFTAMAIHTINCRRQPSKYMNGGWMELINPGQENIFSFVLAWTLFYGTRSPIIPANILMFPRCGSR
jgi:ER membrane protein complex subunit 6